MQGLTVTVLSTTPVGLLLTVFNGPDFTYSSPDQTVQIIKKIKTFRPMLLTSNMFYDMHSFELNWSSLRK
jgi:hypothetical protein